MNYPKINAIPSVELQGLDKYHYGGFCIRLTDADLAIKPLAIPLSMYTSPGINLSGAENGLDIAPFIR